LNDFRLAQVHYEMAVEVDPTFANAFFNLALVQSINKDFTAAISALTKYQALVSENEARDVEEMLRSLKTSLASAKNPRLKST
jgi:Flp pilus assembly protein TadD